MESNKKRTTIKWAVAGFFCLATVFSSCQKDEKGGATPNFEMEFCDAYVNQNAVVAKLTMDDGRTYDVGGQGVRLASGQGNVTFRAVVRFARQGKGVRMYNVEQAFCQQALPVDSFKNRPLDPVKLTSVWRGGKYLNFILGEMTDDQAIHAYGFCIDSLASRTLHVSVLHKQPKNDEQAYTNRRYLSMPLATKYVDAAKYDSVQIVVRDYNDAYRSYVFAK